MKKFFSLLLALSLALALTACGGSTDTGDTAADDTTAETAAEPVELYVFAAASMQESLDQVIEGARSREKNFFMGDLPFLMIVCSSRLGKSGVKPA